MNCGEFQNRLTAWLRDEVDEAAAPALEAHLSQCPTCQAALEEKQMDDRLVRTALAEPVAAARVAERVIARLAAEATPVTSHPVPRTALSWATWILPLITLAAGFLLAMFILPREKEEKFQPPVARIPQPAPPVVPVAHLVASTGRVERYDDERKDWVAIDPQKKFECPSDSRLRTVDDVRCELQTSDGCVIRLNDRTEVTLVGTSTIELQRGQVWCRSPGETSLEVRVATLPADAKDPKQSPSTMWCVGPSCLMTNIEDAGRVQVVTAEGEVNLRTPAGQEKLRSGQVVEIRNGEVTKPNRYVDPVLATRWMQPLIIKQGPDNSELQQRVDTMLAQIGRSKVATMYEQEIRSLGEHAVLPLVRFVQSPLSQDDPVKRSTAIQLIADLAPVWLIPDLIDLLEDRDPIVRQLSAQTLLRLTGLTMSQSPQQWREEPNDAQRTALADWRSWWAAHQHQYPTHHLRITKEG
jgi:hypothetical protein